MEVKDMINGLWGKSSPEEMMSPVAETLNGIQVKKSRSDTFQPNILMQAQNTFNGSPNPQGQGGQPGNPPKGGTVGNLIPPGWSSQAAK